MVFAFILFVSIICGIYVFFQLYAPFGGKPTRPKNRGHKVTRSVNFSRGKFTNAIPTRMHIRLGDITSIFWAFLRGNPRRKPSRSLPVQSLDLKKLPGTMPEHITWFGHSTFLLQMKDKTLLLDPMFGRSPSPFPAIGPKRFSNTLPLAINELPPIDAVIISHDHYDHLDYGSIKQLRHKVRHFFVPLGVGAHLERWGVSSQAITEMDWWEETTYQGLRLACTPARHFSGRTLTDRFATLWCSWVIAAGDTTLFFSGDTGYGPHFKQIGSKYGPFDLTLMECGQYDKRWPHVHMLPEQTVTAHQELGGRHLIPIHWGAFVLALHDWTDPIERMIKAAKKAGVRVATPRIGEAIAIKGQTYPDKAWWQGYTT